MPEFEHEPGFPKKWLDKKQYIRVDPVTGKPELIRVEPMVTEAGELIAHSVLVYVDNNSPMAMDREQIEAYLATLNCVPVEDVSQYKHKKIH
jgi:hypothetical protein